MKKIHILGVAISAAMCVPMAAQASDGIINFTGALNSSTCTVTNGSPTGTIAVTLPTLATATLATAGKTAGDTGFQIDIGNCTAGATSFTPYFESGTNTDPLTGRLNTTGVATNVQLQLLNSTGTVIDVSKGPTAQNVVINTLVGGALTGTGRYIVRYWATGATTPGSVISSVTYSMSYL